MRSRPAVTCTRLPKKRACCRHAATTGAAPSATKRSCQCSSRAHSAAANSARATVVPRTIATDVAMVASSSGKARTFRFTPMPTTTWCTRSRSALISVKMPATFLPSTSTSFGHLSAGTTSNCTSASATATPAASVSGGTRCGASGGRSTTEKYKLDPGGECQRRPSRPRPRVCSSATTTAPAGAPARAHAAASSLVDSTDGRCRHARPSHAVVSRAATTSALSASGSASSR